LYLTQYDGLDTSIDRPVDASIARMDKEVKEQRASAPFEP